MKPLALQTLSVLRRHRQGLLIFYLFFAGLAFAVLTPGLSWALTALRPVTGQAAITTGGLVHFLSAPGGLLWLVVTLTFTVFLLLLQQAGMTLIATGKGKEYGLVLSALWGLVKKLRSLLALTAIQVVAHLALALPFLLVIVLANEHLLSTYDLVALRLDRPPALWWFLGITGTALVAMAIGNGWLYLRWLLAVPALVLEDLGARAALRRSVQLERNQRRSTAVALLSGLALVIALPVLVTLAFRQAAGPLLAVLPNRMELLLPVMLFYAGLTILLTITLAFFAIAAYSTLLFTVYRHATGHKPGYTTANPPTRAGPLAWSAEALLVALAMTQSGLALTAFELQDDITVTAHRGSSIDAPENTMSAIQLALEDGADYVEIDLRMTADGVPVLWHDADMQRVFGLEGRISDLTFEQARERDAGSWFGPAFTGERIVSLEQAINTLKGRAGLYLDIKPTPDTSDLTRAVIDLLQENDAVQGTVIAAADWSVLAEAKRLEPGVKTALLAQFIVGPLPDDRFDSLALRQNRVTAAAVARAHRAGHELHVWTVNDPEAMSRFIDMGVDNIITDRPALLAGLLQQRRELTDAELFVTKMRNWLR